MPSQTCTGQEAHNRASRQACRHPAAAGRPAPVLQAGAAVNAQVLHGTASKTLMGGWEEGERTTEGQRNKQYQ